MPSILHRWNRFWSPQGHSPILDRVGYFESPEAALFGQGNRDCRTLSALYEVPCLVLLGEPGSGKSLEMKAEFTRIQALDATAGSGDTSLFFNLRAYNSRTDLSREIFQSASFMAWRNASPVGNEGPSLTLFLDSLDEGLIEIRNLAMILEEEFHDLPLARLKLRISCRTAEWPIFLTENFASAWSKAVQVASSDSVQSDVQKTTEQKSVRVYELAPLRREDVALAARDRGLDDGPFLEAIEARECVALATLPVTLLLLLRLALHGQEPVGGGNLPDSRLELYRQGLLHLCAEPSERERAGHVGTLSPPQKLALAMRLCALCIFGGRSSIYIPRDQHLELTPPPEHQTDLLAAETLGGLEPVTDFQKNSAKLPHVEMTHNGLLEAINTGLYKGQGEACFVWSHQTFAEFLAAEFILRHEMPLAQIVSLFTVQEGNIAPQLFETAAWLAAQHDEFRRWLLENQPELFQRTDAAFLTNELRALIVGALLGAIEKGAARDHEIDYQKALKLKHPNLSTQLKPWIVDSSRILNARMGAIRLARGCQINELAAELAARALDAGEPKAMRLAAGRAVLALAEQELDREGVMSNELAAALKVMLPLALRQNGDGTPSNDPTDELKSLGLREVWPHSISLSELLPLLDNPDSEHPSQEYASFISYEFVRHLRPDQLPMVLRWIRKQMALRYSGHSTQLRAVPTGGRNFTSAFSERGFLFSEVPGEQLFEEVARLAWEHFLEPGIARPFARLVFLRLNHYQDIFSLDEWSTGGISSRKPSFLELLHEQTTSAIEKRRLLIREIGYILREWQDADPDDYRWVEQRGLLFNYHFQVVCSEDKDWLRQRSTGSGI